MSAREKPPARFREATPTPSLKNVRRPAPLQLALTEPAGKQVPSAATISLPHLWLCIYLPALPLEALTDQQEAAAVCEERHGVRRILLANKCARQAGIGSGQSVNAALALLPTLHLEDRDPLREAQTLQTLAEWCEKFTSFVSVESPALLLLEIAGSLSLFGGLRELRRRIVRGLQSQGFEAQVAIAPTPLAATWLARAGQRVCIRDPKNLVSRLGPLPIHCLDWPAAVADALKGMGVTSVIGALRLPRQGFAKRFGARHLLQLDRALGRMPDPRMSYRAPEQFVAEYELSEEQSDAELLLNICRELLAKLETFLRTRQIAVQHIELVFFHLQTAATRLSLGCVQPDRAVQHWFDLLQIKFDRISLAAPVIAVQLSAGQGQVFLAATETLPFKRQEKKPDIPIEHLAERLCARIGSEAVHGVMAVAEHRPQYAWQAHSVLDAVPHCPHGPLCIPDPYAPELLADIRRTNSLVLQRPLWILAEPRPLESRQKLPWHQGRLTLLQGPERLETGWWDEHSIARDYFVAVNPAGVRLWVYRERGRKSHEWYLHGMFG